MNEWVVQVYGASTNKWSTLSKSWYISSWDNITDVKIHMPEQTLEDCIIRLRKHLTGRMLYTDDAIRIYNVKTKEAIPADII